MDCNSVVQKRPYFLIEDPIKDCLIEEMIPGELIIRIFSYLNKKEILAATLVNHNWNACGFYTITNRITFTFKTYINEITDQLKPQYNDQIIQLKGLIPSLSQINDTPCLCDIDEILLTTEKQEITVLKAIESGDLMDLENQIFHIKKPSFLKNTINKAKLYQQLDEAKLIEDKDARNGKLEEISQAFSNDELFKEAIEIAGSINDNEIADSALLYAVYGLIDLKRLNEAWQVACMMKTSDKDDALIKIIDKLVDDGFLDQAHQIAIELTDLEKKESVYKSIFTKFTTLKSSTHSLKFACQIPEIISELEISDELLEIVDKLIEFNLLTQALDLAFLMNSDDALFSLVIAYSETGDFQAAYEMANSMQDKQLINDALSTIESYNT